MNSPEKGKAGRERAADAGGGAGAGGAATAEAGPGLSLDLARLRFDERGLVAAIAQDAFTGRVLMLAWANREAVERTLATGEAWFWSRSRAELWRKGETSGNVLRVMEIAADCDGDALLLAVEPAGPACHTGATSCFDCRSCVGSEAGGLDLGALERIVRSRAGGGPGCQLHRAARWPRARRGSRRKWARKRPRSSSPHWRAECDPKNRSGA